MYLAPPARPLGRTLALGLAVCLVLACASRGRVVVLAEEPTAQVWVDGVPVGRVGSEGFEVEPGPHTVEVKATGFAPWSTEVQVGTEEPTVLQAELEELLAFLVVRSNVSGDTVWIDGKAMGPSGPDRHRVRAGPHTVRVERPGYTPFTQRVVLEPDETETVRATLVAVGAADTAPHGGQAETQPQVVPAPTPVYVPRPYRVPRPRGPRPPRPPRPRLP